MKCRLLTIILLLAVKVLTAQQVTDKHIPAAKPGKDSIDIIIRKAIETGKTDTAKADKLFRKAAAAAAKAGENLKAGNAFYEMGEMYFRFKNHNKSFGSFFNARNYFNRAGAEKEASYALFGLGRQQYYRGNYKVATGHLNYAIRGAVKFKLPALEAESMEYIGILYHLMPGTMHLSTTYLKSSLAIKQGLKDEKGMLRVLEKLADTYYQQKKFDTALQYHDQSISLATKLKLLHNADLSRLNRVGTYIKLNQLQVAKTELDDVMAHTVDTSDLNVMIRYFIQQGNYAIAQNELDKGKVNYQQALELAGRIGVPEMYGMVYQHMAEAFSHKGLYKEAFEYLQQYSIQMAGFYGENIPVIKELELILNTNLTKDKVAYLDAENNKKAAILAGEKKMRRILLTGSVIFLLMAVTIFYFYRKQKKQNAIVRTQAEQLQNMLTETDHRVKNNLQIIAGMLDLQAMAINDEAASRVIKECKSRVQSMALIHQDLYSEKSAKGISIDVYINDLVQSVFNAYNIRQDKVQLVTNIEKLNLDVATVIPIGLVLNELISNCLKYAFTDAGNGIIELTVKIKNDLLFLLVKDNGKGFAQEMNTANHSSFGMQIIKAFAQKLNATVDIYNDNGACVSMHIKNYRLLN